MRRTSFLRFPSEINLLLRTASGESPKSQTLAASNPLPHSLGQVKWLKMQRENLLLILLLLSQITCKMLKAKCSLTSPRNALDWKYHFKPGDYLIGGIISANKAVRHLYNFSASPSSQVFLWWVNFGRWSRCSFICWWSSLSLSLPLFYNGLFSVSGLS